MADIGHPHISTRTIIQSKHSSYQSSMRSTLLILALATAGAMAAGNALDLGSRMRLRNQQSGFGQGIQLSDGKARVRRAAAPQTNSTSYGFAKLAPDADLDSLASLGLEVMSERGGIAVVSFPTENIEAIAAADGVIRLQLSQELQPKLDKARASAGVDKIHAGIDLPQAYTGKGVVCGIVDGGMDPNHINFKDADGNTRVKSFAYRRYNDAGTQMLSSTYTPEQLPNFTTDDATAYHGTHTMGIMAGGYRGDVKLTRATGEDGNIVLTTDANPYYGVAYDADIAASCGTLQDAFIAYGVSGILDYSYEHRQPAVVNLSLGSNLGPHDGRGMLSQYLAAEANSGYGIFCISSGNEGDLPIALNKTFAEGDTVLKTFVRPYVYGPENANLRYGTINVYSEDDSEFELQAVIFNQSRGREILRIPMQGNTEGQALYYVSSSDYGEGTVSGNLAKAFDGYIGVGSMIDEETGRFYAIVDYFTEDNQTTNADGNYILGLIVSHKPGKRVDIFCDGLYTDLNGYGVEGWSDGSCNGSISDLATTPLAIIVGSYDTRDSWTSLDRNAYGYDGLFEDGTISEFSSYGTLADGRNLPHICAPGATVISSTSTHFVQNAGNGISAAYLQASVKTDSRTDYWEQMAGTSMATPVVAGAIALWLEADPTLTTEEVLAIIQKTATVDEDVLTTGDPVQWGAGKFNAYAGLKEVLGLTGISSVRADHGTPILTSDGDRRFEVFLSGAKNLDVHVHDMAGRTIAATDADGDQTIIDLSGVAAGVYAVTVNGNTVRVIVK